MEATCAYEEPLAALEPVDKNVLAGRDLRQCVPGHVGMHKVVPVRADTIEEQQRMFVTLTVLGGSSRGDLAVGIARQLSDVANRVMPMVARWATVR